METNQRQACIQYYFDYFRDFNIIDDIINWPKVLSMYIVVERKQETKEVFVKQGGECKFVNWLSIHIASNQYWWESNCMYKSFEMDWLFEENNFSF